MRLSPSHGNCCTMRCRAALRPKNVAGEYGQLRRDFKTSDAPDCYWRTGFGVRNALSKGIRNAPLRPWVSGSLRTQVHVDTTDAPSMARLYPAMHRSWSGRIRHPPGASHRPPERPGSARRIIRAVRSPGLLLRGRWRYPPPRTAPGRPGRTGRPRRPPTRPRRRAATPVSPRRRPGSARRAVRMPAAGTTAGSTGGDVPSRRRTRLDRTSGTAAGGGDGSRLPTLVGIARRSRYH